jgi:two-component system, LytTR family, response regulator
MIKTAIVDDEKGAANSLKTMLSALSTPVAHVGTAYNVPDGIKLIRSEQPHVVFLDINMPFHDGFDLLSHFGNRDFLVVFVTAHEEHTLKAIKHHAFDYLLKPIDPDELEACLEKIAGYYTETGKTKAATYDTDRVVKKEAERHMTIPIRDGMVFIRQEDIVRVEGEGSYSVFYTTGNEKYVSSRYLGEFEEVLPAEYFFRIHKSHLINIRKVRKYLKKDGYYVEMEDGSVLEVARRRKDDLLALINARA